MLKSTGINLMQTQEFDTIPEKVGGQSHRLMINKYMQSVNKWAGSAGADLQPVSSVEMSHTQSFNTPKHSANQINLFHDSRCGVSNA